MNPGDTAAAGHRRACRRCPRSDGWGHSIDSPLHGSGIRESNDPIFLSPLPCPSPAFVLSDTGVPADTIGGDALCAGES